MNCIYCGQESNGKKYCSRQHMFNYLANQRTKQRAEYKQQCIELMKDIELLNQEIDRLKKEINKLLIK